MTWIAAFAGVLCGVLICYASEIVPRLSGGLEGEPAPLADALKLWRPQSRWFRLHALVIAASGIGAALLHMRMGLTLSFLSVGGLSLLFVLITLIDVKYRLVPNLLTYPTFLLVLVVHVAVLHTDLRPLLLGVGMAFGIFALTAWLRRGEVGGGDVKLAALLGAIFGFPSIMGVLLVGVGLGAVAAVILMKTKPQQAAMAYAPYLCLGGFVLLIVQFV